MITVATFLLFDKPLMIFCDLRNLRTQGFDEFMNVVVDEAAEVYVKDAKPRRDLGTFSSIEMPMITHPSAGRILLKGDNITLIEQVS